MATYRNKAYLNAAAERRGYLKTPAEQRAQAQTYAAQKQAERAKQEQNELPDWMTSNPLYRIGQTNQRLGGKVLTGALKSVEGVVDAAIGIGGAVAGIFSEEAKETAQRLIRYDATEEWIGKHMDELTQYSYTTEGKAGEILENVASGVGQMLPAIAVSVATAGAAAPSMGAKAAALGQKVSLATLGVSATGTSTEEAYRDGAEYYRGLGYGAVRGATEAGTEMLVGNLGGKLFGKGLADNALKGLTKTAAGRLATEAVGESAEEALSELANPATKAIYKGRDALKEYKDPEYWKGVGESALVGGLTSLAFGGTVGQIGSRGSARLDADVEEIKKINQRYAAGEGSAEELHAELGKTLSDVEQTLKKATDENRAKLIKNYGLSSMFDSDGSMRADFAAKTGFKSAESQTVTPDGKTKQRGFSEYQTPSLWLNSEKVDNDLSDINEQLRKDDLENGGTGEIAEVKTFEGSLSEQGQKALGKIKKAAYALSERAKSGFDLAIVEPNGVFNGALHNGTMYISADALENGSWLKTLIEETTHFTEGTKEYAKFVQFLAKDPDLFEAAMANIIDTEDSKKGYGFTYDLAESAIGKLSRSPKNIGVKAQSTPQYSLRYTTNNRAVAVIDNDIFEGKFNELSESERVRIVKNVIKQFRPGVPVSGRLIGITRKTAEHFANSDYTDKLRNHDPNVYEDKLNLAQNIDDVVYASTDYINEELKHPRDDNIIQFARGTVLLDIGGRQYKANVIVGFTKENEMVLYDIQDLNLTKFDLKKQKAQPTLAGNESSTRKTVVPSTDSIPDSEEKVNSSEEDFLNEKERELLSEWNAHASADLLGGDEAFVDKLIRENTTLAEKLLNHISDLASAIKSLSDPAARAEYQRLKKAEKLFLNAVSKAGRQYVNGKIVMRREEEETDSIKPQEIVKRLSDQEQEEGKKIAEFISDVSNMLDQSKISKRKHRVGKVSSTHRDIIDSLMQTIDPNFSSKGYELWIDGTGADHINIRHGEKGQADHSMATQEAKMLIPWGANNAETGEFIRDSSGNLRRSTRFFNSDGSRAYEIRVQKAIDGDTIYVSECVPDSANKRIYITSAYIKKGSANQLLNMDAETSPQLTPKASFDGSTTNNSISDPEQNVKSKSQFSRIPSSNQQDSSSWQEANESFLREYSQAPTSSEQSDTAKKPRKKPTEKSQYKVYSKQDASEIIETVTAERLGFGDYYGELKGGKKQDVVTTLWKALNQAEKGKQLSVIEKVADFILQSSTLEYVHTDLLLEEKSEAMETLSLLKPYLHRINLDGLRGEIRHRYDNRAKSVYLTWGTRKGERGLGVDQVAAELADGGYMLEGENEADLLFSLYEAYRSSAQMLKKEAKVYLNEALSKEEYLSAKQEIVNELLRGFDYTGKYPQISFREQYQKTVQGLKAEVAQGEARLRAAQGENRRLAEWKERLEKNNEELTQRFKEQKILHRAEQKETLERVKILGNLMNLADRMKDLKLGTFLNSSQYKSDVFKSSVEKLARINFRGNLNVSGTRKILADLLSWYQKENPLLNYKDEKHPGLYRGEIAESIQWIANNDGKGLSNEELRCLRDDIMPYFIHLVENYNRVYRNGAYEDAMPFAKKYVEGIERVHHSKNGALKAFRSFFRIFGDPASVMRFADQYDEKGFFTESFEELRSGAIGAAETEMDLMKGWNDFFAGKKGNEKLQEKILKDIPSVKSLSKKVAEKIDGMQSWEDINGFSGNEKRSRIHNLAQEFGVFKAYEREGLAFEFTHNNFRESYGKQKSNFENFAKMFSVFDSVLKNAVKIEVHNREGYKPDPTLKNVHVFMSAFEDGDKIVPVKLEVKEFSDKPNTLYVAITSNEIKRAEVSKQGTTENGVAQGSRSANISIPDLMRNVNPQDVNFTKYFPTEFLNSAQRRALIQNSKSSEVTPKQYRKHFTEDTVTYNGVQIPVRVGISLYMTLKRRQAWAGLCRSGGQMFLEGERTKIPALTSDPDAKLSEEEMKRMTETASKELYDQFTDEDKRLIRVVEEAFKTCSSLKEKTDMVRFGTSNVMKLGYYFPIRRANVAQNMDTFHGEADRVSHLGFNQDTVQGAAGELLIEPLDGVFARHIKGISMYANLAIPTDNLNRLLNLNTVENNNKPITVLSKLKSTPFGNDMYTYLDKLKQDMEGVPNDEKDIKELTRAVGMIRSGYAKYQLGANPKVWVTQLSSLAASTGILSYDAVLKGIAVSDTMKDVDKYCKLAELRHTENSVALAQGVMEKTGKVGDVMMKPIGWMDRFVISRLFGACQIQIQKDRGLALGTEENKKAAGELLTRVILETQQNSIATERSSAMRSGNEIAKSVTMFSADAMKLTGRLIDSVGRVSVLRHRIKTDGSRATDSLQSDLKKARLDFRKSLAAMVISAVMMAAIAQGFRWLYRKDEDKEPEEIAWSMTGDFVGNMIGGLPVLRDIYSYFVDGYEMENFLYSTVNDTLDAFDGVGELIGDLCNGVEVSAADLASRIRKLIYAASQMVGLPTRNAYNVVSGLINRFSPGTGYRLNSLFYDQGYRSDLNRAIEAGDDKMIATVASLMTKERIGSESEATLSAIRALVADGYDNVLPRVLGDSVTYEGEEIELSAKQKKRFREVYDIADESVDTLVKLARFKEANSEIQAKAIRFVYDTYYYLAVEDLIGGESGKNTLFAEAIDIEKLALIVSTARSLNADKDQNGKSVSGSKKAKVIAYIESLRLSAAQKYMILGYLGYKNTNGEAKVRAYINTLKLSGTEKSALLEYSGYAA